jgi:hypothetical protein
MLFEPFAVIVSFYALATRARSRRDRRILAALIGYAIVALALIAANTEGLTASKLGSHVVALALLPAIVGLVVAEMAAHRQARRDDRRAPGRAGDPGFQGGCAGTRPHRPRPARRRRPWRECHGAQGRGSTTEPGDRPAGRQICVARGDCLRPRSADGPSAHHRNVPGGPRLTGGGPVWPRLSSGSARAGWKSQCP